MLFNGLELMWLKLYQSGISLNDMKWPKVFFWKEIDIIITNENFLPESLKNTYIYLEPWIKKSSEKCSSYILPYVIKNQVQI